MTDSPSYDYRWKVVLLGDTEVGKTNIVSQFTQGQFDENIKRTLGVKPTLKMTQVGSSTVKVAVWDTAGQERLRAPAVNYYYDAVAVVIVYDITSRKSFEDASKWLDEARDNAEPGVVMMLVGNKSDLGNLRVVETKRAVRTEEGALFARKEKLLFAEISAKYTSQVEGAFQTLLNSASPSQLFF
ncbi:small GTPase superfamily [Fusarium flagelliforme]|uniref:small GTPase superfamily n=1 Tax=Fusarium flagelliforme TaxID=2675880 RepID=UPI001E8D3CA3|nr:small GTPase superfamily [Fusarium flagelliforme]KAH7179876.1 small GTPase superfamily [Fusarium flagelliforme]